MIPNFLDRVTSDIHLILDTSNIREQGTSLKVTLKKHFQETSTLTETVELDDVGLAAIRLIGTAFMGISALITLSAIPHVLFFGKALRLALGVMTFAVGHDVFVASQNISTIGSTAGEGEKQITLAREWSKGLLLKPIVEPFVYRFLRDRKNLSAELI